MDNTLFENFCKVEIVNYVRDNFRRVIKPEDVYIVWMCKTLRNNKALVSTRLLDNMYYEITYNGDNDEMYVDCYEKRGTYTVHLGK